MEGSNCSIVHKLAAGLSHGKRKNEAMARRTSTEGEVVYKNSLESTVE